MYEALKTISMKFVLIALFVFIALSGAYAIEVQKGEATEEMALDWPRYIDTDNARIVIYQPQIESYENNMLEALAAVSVTTPELEDPVFGAFWFTSRMETDRDERLVTLVDLTVTAVKFPEASQEDLDAFTRIVETEVPKWDLTISLDRLIAGLDLVAKEKEASAKLNNDPPKIIYMDEPAVLVIIDGDPILKEIENTKLKYIVNTPFFIVYDASKKTYYLKGEDWWYSSREVTGDWKLDDNPPKEAVEIAKQSEEQMAAQMKEQMEAEGVEAEEEEVEEQETPSTPPKIVVSTVPAELIVSDGVPSYQPINETGLLYMSNTDSDVLMDINTQTYFVLLAGRWYRSSSLEKGPWIFIPHDEVPEDFANIPAESDMGNVRVSVAGTQEAKEAVLENEIPQTAVVNRSEAKVEVTYDGDPKFEQVGETEMKYAVNTDKSVLLINSRYYCCDEAVWFIADGPAGPWAVCDEIPNEVQTIPPDNPVYQVKYVYIYDSTPEVVYVGYTPGYTCSYVYHGCVVYGTGYYYRPWYGYHYYPRPVTYGFGVHWNPWTGWGFSFGYSVGWFNVRIGWGGYRGWWGPGGYRYSYRHGYRHGYRRGYSHGARRGYAAGYRHGQNQNMYKNRKSGVAQTQDRKRSASQRQASAGGRTQTGQARQNNVYADRNGNVHRKTDQGWESRSKDGWSSTGRDTRDKSTQQRQTRESSSSQRSTRESSTRQQSSKQQSNLDRQAQSRSKGSSRTNDYRSSQRSTRSSSSGQRSTRSKSGGGGRRR